jgi:eukaryotic-like serine/threonine-protein kinase
MAIPPSRSMVEAIVLGATSLVDNRDREMFLAAASSGDPKLLALVRQRLATRDDAEQYPAPLPPASPSTSAPAHPLDFEALLNGGERLGENIDRYKLLQKIGEGGYGVVYLAEQQEPVKRQVALKIIKLGMDTRSVIARFEAERQALALMEHPNIARVLDAGATIQGRPYFVMELVNGTRITDYCRHHKLGLRQRLELFIQVCHAVQHAHHKGIIHRDLKPSNILVAEPDGIPTPKVIDFGIAKAIAGKLPGETWLLTSEHILGTPAYMSPEQAVPYSPDVDTRSDIYSLGALLYELLTGQPPFNSGELLRQGFDEMRRTLSEQEPQRPSAVFTSRGGTQNATAAGFDNARADWLLTQLAGDLDWIAMKALEKDRARRYETAKDLAGDVARYLSHDPVTAHPPGRWYRLQKMARRNKSFFAATSAVLLALVFGFGTATWLYLKARQAEQQESRLRLEAEAAKTDETQLRLQAEARERLTTVVILENQGKHEAAARQLALMNTPPTRPSLDGISALRSVGSWLASNGRWTEAANQYLTLLKIDELDNSGIITRDYLACGTLLAEADNQEAFDKFRREALAKFSSETNGVIAARLLCGCLLRPVPQDLLQASQPLGKCLDTWTDTIATNGFSGWTSIPICLWNYRQGNFQATLDFSQRGLTAQVPDTAYGAALNAIAALALENLQRHDEALVKLAAAEQIINSGFEHGLKRGNHAIGYWRDWLCAHILLREAETTVNRPTITNIKNQS